MEKVLLTRSRVRQPQLFTKEAWVWPTEDGEEKV